MTIEILRKAQSLRSVTYKAEQAIRLLKLEAPDRDDFKALGEAIFELNKASKCFPDILKEIRDQAESEFNSL